MGAQPGARARTWMLAPDDEGELEGASPRPASAPLLRPELDGATATGVATGAAIVPLGATVMHDFTIAVLRHTWHEVSS